MAGPKFTVESAPRAARTELAHFTLNQKLERECELTSINRQDLQHKQQHLLLIGKRAVALGFKWVALASE